MCFKVVLDSNLWQSISQLKNRLEMGICYLSCINCVALSAFIIAIHLTPATYCCLICSGQLTTASVMNAAWSWTCLHFTTCNQYWSTLVTSQAENLVQVLSTYVPHLHWLSPTVFDRLHVYNFCSH